MKQDALQQICDVADNPKPTLADITRAYSALDWLLLPSLGSGKDMAGVSDASPLKSRLRALGKLPDLETTKGKIGEAIGDGDTHGAHQLIKKVAKELRSL